MDGWGERGGRAGELMLELRNNAQSERVLLRKVYPLIVNPARPRSPLHSSPRVLGCDNHPDTRARTSTFVSTSHAHRQYRLRKGRRQVDARRVQDVCRRGGAGVAKGRIALDNGAVDRSRRVGIQSHRIERPLSRRRGQGVRPNAARAPLGAPILRHRQSDGRSR